MITSCAKMWSGYIVEEKSVKPRKILVGVIRLQVSISVTVIEGADETIS